MRGRRGQTAILALLVPTELPGPQDLMALMVLQVLPGPTDKTEPWVRLGRRVHKVRLALTEPLVLRAFKGFQEPMDKTVLLGLLGPTDKMVHPVQMV